MIYFFFKRILFFGSLCVYVRHLALSPNSNNSVTLAHRQTVPNADGAPPCVELEESMPGGLSCLKTGDLGEGAIPLSPLCVACRCRHLRDMGA